MEKVLEISLAWADVPIDACAHLSLPAMPYEILDAMAKARIGERDPQNAMIENYHCCEFIGKYLKHASTVAELNALATKLAELSEEQIDRFEGLVEMEHEKGYGSITVGRMYNLASSADCCEYIHAGTDKELGDYYLENHLLSQYENLPEIARNKLDRAAIGREVREAEGGVFLQDGYGYVRQTSELVGGYSQIDLSVREPEYTMTLDIVGIPTRKSTSLALPASEEAMQKTLKEIGAESWDDVSYRCTECRVPSFRYAITKAENVGTAAKVAAALKKLNADEVLKLKALSAAKGISDLSDALQKMQQLDYYTLNTKFCSYADVAREKLSDIVEKKDAEILKRHLNLNEYGESVARQDNLSMTSYGGIRRRDGQPIQVCKSTLSPEQAREDEPEVGSSQQEQATSGMRMEL